MVWCNWSPTAPSAGLSYLSTICSGWIQEWQVWCDWLLQEEAAMTQWMLHRISSTASAGSGPSSSLLSPSPSLFSPPVPLILTPPPLLSLLCPSSSSSSSSTTDRESSSNSIGSRRTGRCAEAWLPPAVQARRRVLLWSLSRTIYLRRVCVCVCMFVCVRASGE